MEQEKDYSKYTKDQLAKEMTTKQLLFCREYLIDLNITQAAIRAKYSKNTARNSGSENMRKPYIARYIQILLDEAYLSEAEVKKLISDTARASLNDYLKIVTRTRQKSIKVGLQAKIDEILINIEKKKVYASRVELDDEAAIHHDSVIRNMENEIIKLEIDLEFNPEETFIVYEEEEYLAVELDMVKLAQDKELGRIRSLEFKEFGPKVELRDPDKATEILAKIHGLMITKIDGEIDNRNTNLNVEVSPEEAKAIYKQIMKDI